VTKFFTGEKTASLPNCAGKSEYPDAEDLNSFPTSHIVQKTTQNEPKTLMESMKL
jgi:hypothetical protein